MAYKLGGTGSNTSPGTFSQKASNAWNKFAEGQKIFNKKPVISDRTKQNISNFIKDDKTYGPASGIKNVFKKGYKAVKNAWMGSSSESNKIKAIGEPTVKKLPRMEGDNRKNKKVIKGELKKEKGPRKPLKPQAKPMKQRLNK